MKVLHNHVCSLCNETKTCFVFSDFETLFSCCNDCFEELEQHLSFEDEKEGECSLCENRKMIKEVDFDKGFLFEKFKICNSCNNHLKKLVELGSKEN